MQQAIEQLKKLAYDPRYEAGFIFGSVARGDHGEDSDLDVNIITTADNPSLDILHPHVGGRKLDLTFLSYGQLQARTEQEFKGNIPRRIPMVGEAIILFDTNGRTTKLHDACRQVVPPRFTESEYAQQRFLLYHANDKIARNIGVDYATAMLAMHIGINDVLKIHYGIHGRWWLSNKRLLKDIAAWDESLFFLLSRFLNCSGVGEKFSHWSAVLEHVSSPFGGYREIDDRSAISDVSQRGLRDLSGDL